MRWIPIEEMTISNDGLIWTMQKPKRVDEGAAFYTRHELGTTETRRRYARDMLLRFVQLHESADEKIRQFAECWGPLLLCRHNMPYQHGPLKGVAKYRLRMPEPNARLQQLVERSRNISKDICYPLNFEPLETWRFFSRQAGAILHIAAFLKRGVPGTRSDWSWVLDDGLPWHTPSQALDINASFLLEALRAWTSLGNFHPWISNLEGKVRVEGADLFAKLAIELALAATGRQAFGVCSVCGREFDAPRKRAAERNQFCNDPNCQREASRLRKWRSRQQQIEDRLSPFLFLSCNYRGCRKPAYEITPGGNERRCELHAQNAEWKQRRTRISLSESKKRLSCQVTRGMGRARRSLSI
jgi:hypothetical protein